MAASEAAVLPVAGLRLAAVSAGIKTPGRLDLVILELAEGARVAATFTRNAFCAAPVQVARHHLQTALPRYFLVNTGNANAGTGEAGRADALACCRALAEAAGVTTDSVLPFSTGVIGEPLPVNTITKALPAALDGLAEAQWLAAAEGIMTTDTRPKAASRQIELDGVPVTLTGMAKGAGMIKPNMATMLAFLATDVAVAAPLLQSLWTEVVDHSFNRVTVDGDTSTNDAAMLVATGVAGVPEISDPADPRLPMLHEALASLALELAHALVRDGEGASKFVTVEVAQAASEAEALEVAYTIAHSPLVKTALFASDPNWGRLLAAIGRADVPELDVDRVELRINGVLIAEAGGRAAGYTEEQGAAAMAADDIHIQVLLQRGEQSANVWTSDLSYDYVRINAEYRT
ncbi:MAG: bifunctional glutamate N-acetyltransferase/amino-acid acetyltransferase ArgJ [Halieaceae bacterium]|jgi:glutamate N-acetyltransferase/amino-acid N-acetyltransferase|nr:bifunctional glutamate N-acetyltransferase/amino-acid acetyltransferase ArgJ [Halieaceae bacterium]